MITFYQYLVRNKETRFEETFRTVHKGYIPEGYELIAELPSFTIGGDDPYGQPEEPKKSETGCIVAIVCVAVVFMILFITLFYAVFDF